MNNTTHNTEPDDAKPKISASDLCFLGAAEAMKYGAKDEGKKVSTADLRGANRARHLFKNYTDQQMAVSLLILMLDLGRRIAEKEMA